MDHPDRPAGIETNAGQKQLPRAVIDPGGDASYWQDISRQAADRLARLAAARPSGAGDLPENTEWIDWRMLRRTSGPALAIAVGAALFVGISYAVLSDLRVARLPAGMATVPAAPR